MYQVIIGLVLGLILVAFFVAVMYYVLPDEAVDKALGFFEDIWRDLLDTTVGRVLDTLFSPVVAMTHALVGFTMAIGTRAGPLAGFSMALLGVLRTSRGLMAMISPEKAMTSLEAMYKATIVLVVLMALGAVSRVAYQGLKSLFFVSIMALRAKRRKSRVRIYMNKSMAIRLGYIIVVVLVVLFGVHVIHQAVEVVRPNSDAAELFRELDLMEKFYLHVISHVEIRRGDEPWLGSTASSLSSWP